MNVLKYFKNYKILLLIFLVISVIVLIIIAVIKALKPTPLPKIKICPGDKIKTPCDDGSIQCADKCINDQHWDCKTSACICKQPDTVLCNNKSVCCPVCSNDMCCADDMVGKDSDGKKICCAQETAPDPSGVGCVAVCGTGTYKKACNQGEFCNQISGLTDADLDSMKNNAGNNYRGIDATKNIYFCSEPPTCSWDSNKDHFLPSLTKHGVPYYSSSKIFGSEVDGICSLPGPYEPDSGCYGATQEQCQGGQCKWTTPLDILSELNGYDKLSSIMEKIAVQKGESPNGHYCSIGDTGNMQWLQYIQKGAESNCSYIDCNNALIEPGVIRIKWDQNSATCSSVKSTNTEGGVKGNVRCTAANIPCSSCTKEGEYVDCVKCYKQGSPCSECTGTEYIPSDSDSCTRANNDWHFKSCVDGNNRVDFYKSSTAGNCGGDTICGNCPFGDNSDPTLFDSGIAGETRYRGSYDTQTNVACVSDGQIWVQPRQKLYKQSKAPSGHGTIFKECTSSDQDCASGDGKAKCDPGYIVNTNNTDCIYICQVDGSRADSKVNNDGNSEHFFDVEKITGYDQNFCFRKYPYKYNGICETAGSNDCQQNSGNNQMQTNINNNDKYIVNKHAEGCKSFNSNNDCYIKIYDQISISNSLTDTSLPIYVFPKDIGSPSIVAPHSDISLPVQCWSLDQDAEPSIMLSTGCYDGDASLGVHHEPLKTAALFCSGELDKIKKST